MNETFFTLKEFVEKYCYYSNPIRVESSYNGKCLAKNYKPGKNEELDARTVTSICPQIRAGEDGAFAMAYLHIFVEGAKEYNENQRTISASLDITNNVDKSVLANV